MVGGRAGLVHRRRNYCPERPVGRSDPPRQFPALLVPFQLVATDFSQPRRKASFEIAPSASRFQVTFSSASVNIVGTALAHAAAAASSALPSAIELLLNF